MPAFLDAASGAPLHPAARTALLAALDDGWADPARLYGAGRRARLLLDAARESMAESLGARPDEISFAANGTQALQAAVLGTIAGNRGDAFVHSAVEHSAVLHSAASADRPVLVPVDRLGRVGVEEFVAAAGAGGVAGAALQAANHEGGTRQPVAEGAARVGPGPLVGHATPTAGQEPPPAGGSVLAGGRADRTGPARRRRHPDRRTGAAAGRMVGAGGRRPDLGWSHARRARGPDRGSVALPLPRGRARGRTTARRPGHPGRRRGGGVPA